ncbi:MAG: acetylglutamate kinase [Candidatus Pelagadaptatus aseana]|uniref:acetylglutamate kinase n=1 Tax=Candidatus Pelagadaptatus aseana TaxID=3120508 RepID=UPI0039B32E21
MRLLKSGGDILQNPSELEGLGENIKSLLNTGWQVIVLHGGGPQTNLLQQQIGITPNKIGGRRITGKQDLRVVKQAIAGEVNVRLTSALLASGVPAFGCHGASGRLIQATKRPPRIVSGSGSDPIDFGEVGDVTGINQNLLQGILDLAVVPVIATLGVAEDGRIFNINADTTVTQIASKMKARLLLLTTQIGGVFEDINNPQSRIGEITPDSAKQLIEAGVIQGGMIPKVEEAVALLDQGVASIAIISPQDSNAFLSVANQEGVCGTVIRKQEQH